MQYNDDFNYVCVIFEDKINSTPGHPKFYGKEYLYKTKVNLKLGQVVEVDTIYGHNMAVVNSILTTEDAIKRANSLGYNLDGLKEIYDEQSDVYRGFTYNG